MKLISCFEWVVVFLFSMGMEFKCIFGMFFEILNWMIFCVKIFDVRVNMEVVINCILGGF